MAPIVESWPASELPLRSQITTSEKARKGFRGDLKACELFQMLQYHCEFEEPVTRETRARCWPAQRLFRRCQDQKGTFTVETTAWEGEKN
ncbi:hypothetical protein LZ554_000711 [Drepanopeziza brunnea f. sp. 'monogermtubi']|nr:hypothetical protein LZ554_000711 [Drepanopeziza brunnea f. sp. 'monogermtubi']